MSNLSLPTMPGQNSLGRLGGQLGVLLCLLGFLVMFFGWNGAASSNFVPAQFPYLISGGLVGLGIVVIGSALLLVQNQRTDMARLEAAVERVALAVERQGGGSAATGAAALQGYVVAGGSSYHLPDCTLPEARTEAHMVPLTDIPNGNLEPCRVCRPPQFGRLLNGAVTPGAPVQPV
jgi:hypothetical protein